MPGPRAPGAVRPHILVILTDQHRFDCLGCAGNPDLRTPHIDRLAAGGVRYTETFCPSPICTPSRYSLFSGRWVHDHNGWSNFTTLSPSIPAWPRVLRDAGYRTAAVGKMHLTPTYLDIGFDEMVLAEQAGEGRWDDDYHRYLREHDLADITDMEDQVEQYHRVARPEYLVSKGCLPCNLDEVHDHTTWIGDRAVERITGWDRAAANLLCVSFIRPHHPMNPPMPWADMYDPRAIRLLPGCREGVLQRNTAYHPGWGVQRHAGLSETDLRLATARYYGAISQIDMQVGRIMAALQARGCADDTLVVFTADHGDYMGFQHMLGKLNYPYDPLVKVPLVVRFPGDERRGVTDPRLASLVDLAPTLCAAAGCMMPGSPPGLDLRSVGPGHPVVFCEFGPDIPLRGKYTVMARTAARKLILTEKAGCGPLFFDLDRDPYELENRIDESRYRGEVSALRSAAAAWSGDGRNWSAFCDEGAPEIRQSNVPADRAALRADQQAWFRGRMRQAGFGL